LANRRKKKEFGTMKYKAESVRIEEKDEFGAVVIARVVDSSDHWDTVWAYVGVPEWNRGTYRAATNGDLSWPLLPGYVTVQRFGDSLDCWCPGVWMDDYEALWDDVADDIRRLAIGEMNHA